MTSGEKDESSKGADDNGLAIYIMNERFPPGLVYRVRESTEESGFCVFGMEEMGRLFSVVRGGRAAKRQMLEEFATFCGVRMETTPNLNSARFVKAVPNDARHLKLCSPACPGKTMEYGEIETGLLGYKCPESGGVWIPLQSFLDWKEHHMPETRELPAAYEPGPADDSKQRALICPESGRVLIRYRVGHGVKFHADVSPETGGIWLGKGEWEALKSKGLHVELNLIFTAPYQRQMRAEEHEEVLAQTFRERIGREDFQKVAAFKEWLGNHPKRRSIRSYLLYDFKDDGD